MMKPAAVPAVFANPDKRVSVEAIDPPPMSDFMVRVRTHYSFISAGTELTQLGLSNHPRTPMRNWPGPTRTR